jgi:hypothetical protein
MYDSGVLAVPRRSKGFMKRISALVGVLGVLALALLAPTAAMAAGSSSCQAYNNQQGCTPTTVTTTSSGTLPFTGLDVVLLVAGGGTLLAAGFVVRRLSRRLD